MTSRGAKRLNLCAEATAILNDAVRLRGEAGGKVNRKLQGTVVAGGILAGIGGFLALADAGASSHCSPQFPKWIGCVLAVREGLAGGLIGAGGALFAGWLAWSALREQIQSERELSKVREHDTLTAILLEMRPLVDALNEVWRAIDAALLPDEPAERRGIRISIANAVLPALPVPPQIAELRALTAEMAKEAAPVKRGQFLRVWQSIDWIYSAMRDERGDRVPHDDDGRFRLKIVRTHLSHFERYLSALDSNTARAFEFRTKEPVDHRGIANQIRPMVDKAVRGEPL